MGWFNDLASSVNNGLNNLFGTNLPTVMPGSNSTPLASNSIINASKPSNLEILKGSTSSDPLSDVDYISQLLTPNSSATSNNLDNLERSIKELIDWGGSLFKSQDQFAQDNRDFNSSEAQKNREWQERQYEIARRFNSSEAKANRDWQEKMSNTSYQRAVKDLQAAGLNPILAYTNFTGSSSPSGSSASISSPSGSSASNSSSGGINAYDMLSLLLGVFNTMVKGTTDYIHGIGEILLF